MEFVNRTEELRALNGWWERPGSSLGLIWGRRRVGKTALIEHFVRQRRAISHTATARPVTDELRTLSLAAAAVLGNRTRDLDARPFTDWLDVLETCAQAATRTRLLLVLDEFPELVRVAPELPAILRAFWDRWQSQTKLRVLLCGSAVRTMTAMQFERAPLYGRIDLRLLVHPFRPHEAALLLPALDPSTRALVWGLVGGIPLYLQWWDQHRSVRHNLSRLACSPGGLLLTEGQLALATEAEAGDIGKQVLHAIASGRTKHHEIADAVRADPTRTLERLIELRLVERMVPVTEDPRRTRRRIYRIADNFLAFWLGVLDRHRAEIERSLGGSILPVLMQELDAYLGPRFEDAFRVQLRRMAERGDLGDGVVAVGPFWTAAADPAEIDAVVLAGRERAAILAGEAKWSRRADGARIRRELERKATALPRRRDDLRFAVCAREEVTGHPDLIRVTADDIFS